MSARLALLAVAAIAAARVASGATITVVNLDGASEGFNDATATAPVGGNSATTLGAQRLAAFQYAADLWGAQLSSTVTIRVGANMDPLTCSATSATLGQAGPTTVHRDFAGAPVANTWYPQALANKLAGSDQSVGNDDISATFNSAIGTTCAFPSTWYYGLDGNPPGGRIDFVAVVLHEIGHGLGFLTFVDETTGQRLLSRDDTFMRNLEDHSTGLGWSAMTDAQRMASAIDTADLHWTGAAVVADSGILSSGRHPSGHVEMYAPNPVQSGSSVSHFSTSLTPNEVMEPIYTGPLHATSLARDLMTDIGWGTATGATTTTTTSTTSTTSTTMTTTSTTTTSTTSTTTSTTNTTTTTPTTSTTTTTTTTTTSTTTSTTQSSTTTTTSTTTTVTSTSTTSTTTSSTTTTTSTTTQSSTTTTATSTTTTSIPTSTTTSSATSTTTTSATTSTEAPASTTSTTLPPQHASTCPPAPAVGCRVSASERSVIVLRDTGDDAKTIVRWKLARGGAAGGTGYRDPDAGGTTVALCLYDATVSVKPRLTLAVPGGGSCGARACWKPLANGGHRYKDRAGVADGVTDVKLRVNAAGEAQVVLKAKGAGVAIGPLGYAPPITAQLVVADGNGETCWQAVFSTTLHNDDQQLRAKTP